MSKVLILNSDVARQAACRYVMAAPNGYAVKISERTRSLDQNAAQWPILDAFAKQLQWPVNGAMQTITATMPLCRIHHDEMHRNPEMWPMQWEMISRTIGAAIESGMLGFRG